MLLLKVIATRMQVKKNQLFLAEKVMKIGKFKRCIHFYLVVEYTAAGGPPDEEAGSFD